MGEILSRDVTLLTCGQKIIVKVNIMGEILSRDIVMLLTCWQKIIVKVNIMEDILSRDVTLLTCWQNMRKIASYAGKKTGIERKMCMDILER